MVKPLEEKKSAAPHEPVLFLPRLQKVDLFSVLDSKFHLSLNQCFISREKKTTFGFFKLKKSSSNTIKIELEEVTWPVK